jgi:putative transposase
VPWRETCPVEQRFQFVMECKKGEETMASLCRAFGISRQTGYKWLNRYEQYGPEGGDPEHLKDKSRRPRSHPNEAGSAVVEVLVRARKKHPTWGPRTLKVWLEKQLESGVKLPAPSTIGEVLKRHGLTRRRKRRRHTPPYTKPFAACTAPNQLWCVDFKGWFRTKDAIKCYPLTITDAFSRVIIRCEGVLDPDGKEVREIFESAFKEFGLPDAIRSDNGPPFASTGVGGLTELSIWWIHLGILHERITPGKPQQNGRHERMHLTLKQDTASPPERTIDVQQRVFDRWRRLFNDERPHQALDMKTPSSLYVPSARLYSDRLTVLEPNWDAEQSLVDKTGHARWGRGKIFIGTALKHELVDFRPAGRRQWEISFGPVVLGLFDETRWKKGLIRPKTRKRRTSQKSESRTLGLPNGSGDAHSAYPDGHPRKDAHRVAPEPQTVRADKDLEKIRTKKITKPPTRVSAMSPV